MEEKFTVLMSVYKKDKPDHLKEAIYSIYNNQTVKPNEIMLIVDGPLTEALYVTIDNIQNEIKCIKTHFFKENKGLGEALRIGVTLSTNELIARMDSDDIAIPDRFKKQISFLKKNSHVDIVGGQINEFIGNEYNIVGKRIVPCGHDNIVSYSKQRCPFNHMTVMLKKSSVLSAGNYIDWHFNEDYYLWIRMEQKGCNFANLPEALVNVRVGKDMYARRGGWQYFKSEKGLQDYMLKNKMIPLPRYAYNVLGRFVIQVLMPNRLRAFIFQKMFRKKDAVERYI